ncbi:hypothetical protein ET33_31345 [Paenibacillus tyrfis]|uniref:Uncharacterized protein n=1 Tax=Paenibacillus tyrfis TaxID=1501230 RepID=A0A081P6P1_9BACL|nr:hypothetical protein ET33_31345 [Paenibacillus tyrfis]
MSVYWFELILVLILFILIGAAITLAILFFLKKYNKGVVKSLINFVTSKGFWLSVLIGAILGPLSVALVIWIALYVEGP